MHTSSISPNVALERADGGSVGWRRVVLVGFMGAGKSTVGRALADRLGWRFVDLDDVVEAAAGKSVAQIFAEDGEVAFRALERSCGRSALDQEGVVLAPGGGWAARSDWVEEVPEGTATIWLDVGPGEAVRRASGDVRSRPLLDVADPVEKSRVLLERRAAGYAAARWRVDTERSSVEDVTARVLDLLSAHPQEDRTE